MKKNLDGFKGNILHIKNYFIKGLKNHNVLNGYTSPVGKIKTSKDYFSINGLDEIDLTNEVSSEFVFPITAIDAVIDSCASIQHYENSQAFNRDNVVLLNGFQEQTVNFNEVIKTSKQSDLQITSSNNIGHQEIVIDITDMFTNQLTKAGVYLVTLDYTGNDTISVTDSVDTSGGNDYDYQGTYCFILELPETFDGGADNYGTISYISNGTDVFHVGVICLQDYED